MSNDKSAFSEVHVVLENDDLERLDLSITDLRAELLKQGFDSAILKPKSVHVEGTKSIDPVILGALVVTVGPTLLTNFLEFLHAWALRRENRVIKVKIQTSEGSSVELEVPETMSHEEASKWIELVKKATKKDSKKN